MAAAAVDAFIIAARRSALGRIGGLHRARRIEDLAAPVIEAVLRDGNVGADRVGSVICGVTTVPGNPARLIGLAAGIGDGACALTIDRQYASGLDAILLAVRDVVAGRIEAAIAGGVDSVSTAPWRIAKPKSLYHLPHFASVDPHSELGGADMAVLEAMEALARSTGIDRERQDAWTYAAHVRAEAARDSRRLVGEIVALRQSREEARDESTDAPLPSDLAAMPPLHSSDGVATRGTVCAAHDGAGFALIVSRQLWQALGRPPALHVVADAVIGVGPRDEAAAAAIATQRMRASLGAAIAFDDIGVVELADRSAIEAIAFTDASGLDAGLVNPAGGSVVRGHPLAAAGAVLVVRLFTEMVRHPAPSRRLGLAALAASGGQGVAALFSLATA